MTDPTPNTRRSPLEHERDDEADLAVAWMAGAENQREHMKHFVEQMRAQRDLARIEADAMRASRDHAENRCHEMALALNEVQALVMGANFARTRYPKAWEHYTGEAVENQG